MAELSSVATALEELAGRVTALAEQSAAAHDDDTATELFSVERALNGATRRLARLLHPGPPRR